jgi:hypothetical protein
MRTRYMLRGMHVACGIVPVVRCSTGTFGMLETDV